MLSPSTTGLVVRWTVLTALGLAAGLVSAIALGGPIQAVVGMVLVTPIVTAMVGTLLGATQVFELRSRLAHPGAWVIATASGLGIGLAAGVVVVEQGGRWLAGHAVNVVRLTPLDRALSVAVIGLVAGVVLGGCQQLVLRRQAPGIRHWMAATTVALGLAFPMASLAVDALLRGIGSAVGIVGFGLGAGLILGALTAPSLRRAM